MNAPINVAPERPAPRNGARFYSSVPLVSGQTVDLSPTVAHHAVRVLRLKPGDPLVLFTGEGGEFDATLVYADRREAQVSVGAWHDVERESMLSVTLAQGLSSAEKMDFTVQKAVELGAIAIEPVGCARSVVQLDDQRTKRRMDHWRQIVVSACEQCGRNRVPRLCAPVSFESLLRAKSNGSRIVLTPRASHGLGNWVLTESSILLLAGPEGGFTLEEENAALAAGFVAVSLGPRILRTETAALAALAALQARFGDL